MSQGIWFNWQYCRLIINTVRSWIFVYRFEAYLHKNVILYITVHIIIHICFFQLAIKRALTSEGLWHSKAFMKHVDSKPEAFKRIKLYVSMYRYHNPILPTGYRSLVFLFRHLIYTAHFIEQQTPIVISLPFTHIDAENAIYLIMRM